MTNHMTGNHYQLTWKVRRLFKLLAGVSDIYLNKMGLRAQERAVIEHLHNWGDSSVPQIARLFYVSRQNIQMRVNALLDKGLVEKVPNPAHQRSVLLSLTQKGKELFGEIQKIECDLIEDLFEGISDDEAHAANITLGQLADNLTKKLSEDSDNETEEEQRE